MKSRIRLQALTGARFWAAAAVVALHFQTLITLFFPGLSCLVPWISQGYLGVDFFFILSGFILCHAHPEMLGGWTFRKHLRFLILRLARIYPVHVATLGVFILLVAGSPWMPIHFDGKYPWSDIPYQLLLLHIWPGREPLSWNYPAWSISAEWFAYVLIFPFACLWVKKKTGFPGLMAGPFIPLIALLPFYPKEVESAWTLWRVTCEFFSGCLLYRCYQQSELLAVRSSHAVLPAILLCLAWVGWQKFIPFPAAGIVFIPMIILGLSSGCGVACSWLGNRWNIYGGEISYSLYMTHALSAKTLKFLLPPGHYEKDALVIRIIVILSHVIFLLGMAMVCHHLIEKPGRKLIRSWAEKYNF